MRQSSGVLQVIGEMVAIVVLALTGRFVSFAQTALESGVPLTTERAYSYFMELLSVFTRVGDAGLLLSVLGVASLIRISIAYANRSVLFGLRERAGIGQEDLTWGQRTLRLPFGIVYRSLNGIATLIGAIALAICFRLFNPESPFGFGELVAYVQSIGSGITFGGVGALVLLFALYGVALTIIGYIASPAVLSLEEMASGLSARSETVAATAKIGLGASIALRRSV
jgi:hypothetical protein